MGNKDLVSIGVLVYNHGLYIEDCLTSLLQQDYPYMELIILDDASTDNSREIIANYYEKLKHRFKNVIFIRHKRNCGIIPRNMNELLKYVQGDFCKWFSGDDIMCPQCISSLVNCMYMHPEASVIYSNGYVINDKFKVGNSIINRRKILLSKPISDTCMNTFRRLMCGNMIPAPGAMFRRSVFMEYGSYDEMIPYEDYEYWIRISRKERFYYLDENLFYYRRTENSLTGYLGKSGKNKVKTSMLSDRMTIQKYLKYLSAEDRKHAIASYYQKYYQMSYDINFYRGFIVTAYRIKKLDIGVSLDFFNMISQMIINTLDYKSGIH